MKKTFIPSIVALVGAVLMLVSLFLPFAVANEDMIERIEKYPDELVFEDGDMTSSDLKTISLVKFSYLFSNLYKDSDNGTFYLVFGIVALVVTALCVLLSACKKPIGAVVFSLLSYGVFYLWNYDLSFDREIVPGRNFDYGIGYYIYYLAIAITISGCIWLLVTK